MKWITRLIHRLLPGDRYHEQAGKVEDRQLRIELLNKQLHVIERRGK